MNLEGNMGEKYGIPHPRMTILLLFAVDDFHFLFSQTDWHDWSVFLISSDSLSSGYCSAVTAADILQGPAGISTVSWS